MSEPTFSDLHPGAASTLTTGVDLAGTASADLAAQSLANFGASAGAGGDAVVLMAPPPKLASFMVYWNPTAKKLQMHNPKVVYGSKIVQSVTGDDSLSSGNSYYCVVKVSKAGTTSETVTAVVQNSSSAEADDKDTAVASIVPICQIDKDGNVTQHHVGAIVVGKQSTDAAEYIAGDDTCIVFTSETDDDGSETGKIDVYYK